MNSENCTPSLGEESVLHSKQESEQNGVLDEFLNKAQGARNSKMLRSYILREILGKGKLKSSARNTKELNSNTPV